MEKFVDGLGQQRGLYAGNETHLYFDDAVRFAEKQGWDYYVQQPTVKVRSINSNLRVVTDAMSTENTTEELWRELCLQAA